MAIGLCGIARHQRCSWCACEFSEAEAQRCCAACGVVGFCSACEGHRAWHVSSGECAALGALGDAHADAEACLVIRAVLRAATASDDEDDDDAACFWDLAGSPDVLSDRQTAHLTAAVDALAPASAVAPLLASHDRAGASGVALLRLALSKLACNSHAFGFGGAGGSGGALGGTGRALWPRVELLNHECAPNAYMTVTPRRGSSVEATVRALRPLARGVVASICYCPLDWMTSAERRAQLHVSYGWACGCGACASGTGDGELTARHTSRRADTDDDGEDDARALAAAVAEAETMLSDGDAEGAADIGRILERGVERLGLAPSHRITFALLALRRDAAAALGDHASAAEFGGAWLAALAASPQLSALLDPATRCHALAAHALALDASARASPSAAARRITRARAKECGVARSRVAEAAELARVTLGVDDPLTKSLSARAAAGCSDDDEHAEGHEEEDCEEA
jgi:hypothetical protein